MNCRCCNQKIKIPSLIYKKYPLYLWPCSKNVKNKSLDLKVFFCGSCNLTQLQRFNNNYIKKFNSQSSNILFDKNLLIKRAKLLKKNIKNYKRKKILEIGGGRNPILNYFTNIRGYISDLSIDEQNRKFKYIKKDFNNSAYKKKFFDYIFFFHTLEHIEDPKKFLSKVHYSLKKDGRIILEVPNLRYFSKYNPSYAFFFQHQSLFTLNSLTNILRINGFEPTRKINKSNDVILLICKKSENFKVFKKENKNIILKINNNIKKRVEKIKKLINKNKYKNLAIYGCGGNSLTFFYHLKKLVKVKYFYDSSKNKENKFIPLTNNNVKFPQNIKSNKSNLILFSNKKLMKLVKRKNPKINTFCFE